MTTEAISGTSTIGCQKLQSRELGLEAQMQEMLAILTLASTSTRTMRLSIRSSPSDCEQRMSETDAELGARNRIRMK